MSTKILIALQTDAATSESFYVSEDASATIHCIPDLAGAETVTVQISTDDETFVSYQDGAAVRLTALINALRLQGPMFYRVVKSVTVSVTAVQKLN